jgi:hypothetical protein
MHKFVQRSRVGVFHNEHTRSTPVDPKLMFWGIRIDSLLHEPRCKISQSGAINAQVRATKSWWNFLKRTHPIHPIGPQTHILEHLGPFCCCTNFSAKWAEVEQLIAQVCTTKSCWNFSQWAHKIHPIGPQTHVLWHFRPFCYCTNFGVKWAELEQLMHKFVLRSHVGIFRNERTRSTPLDPKLIFYGILGHFITAQTSVQNEPNWSN